MSAQPQGKPSQQTTASETVQPGCSPHEIERMFSNIVTQYDQHNRLFTLGLDVWWRRRLVHGMNVPAGARVLDLAAGTLDVSKALVRHFPEVTVVALDICKAMMEHALQSRWDARSEACRKQIVPVLGNALNLPFADESFDAVCISFGLRNINPRRSALKEIFRVLKPGGSVHILELSPVNTPLLGEMCRWYMGSLMPKVAGLKGSSAEAYRYLAESVQAFPEPSKLSAELIYANFSAVDWKPGFLGVVAIHRATKAE